MKRASLAYAACALLVTGTIAVAKVRNISSEAEYDQVRKDHKKVVAKFHMPGCPACKMVDAPFEALSDKAEHKDIQFVAVNIHEAGNRPLSQRYKITGAPTFIYMNDGEKVGMTVGAARNFEERMGAEIDKSFAVATTKQEPTPADAPQKVAQTRATRETKQATKRS